MKKLWITIGAVILVLLCVLAAILFFTKGDRTVMGDANAPYVCSYEQTKDRLKVILSGEVPNGFGWTAECARGNAAVKPGRHNGKIAVFTLTAQQPGSESVSFVLQKPGELPERSYEIRCGFLVTDGLELLAESCVSRALPGLIGGEGATFSYRAAQLTDSELLLRVDHAAGQTWTYSRVGAILLNGSEESSGALTGPEQGAYSELRIAGTKTGAATVYLDSDAGDGVELKFSTGENGVTSLISHRVLDGSETRIQENTAYTDNYGALTEALEAAVGGGGGRVERWLSRDDGVTTFNVGVSEYAVDGSWMLCISPIAEEADFAGHEEPAQTLTEGSVEGRFYVGDYGVRCVWIRGGNTYLLESGDAAPENAESLVRFFMKTVS